MSNELWLDPEASSVEHSISPVDRAHIARLFQTDRPVAWITGSASDRVGRAIARRFALRGYRIVLHANRSIDEGMKLMEVWRGAGIDVSMVTGSIDDEANVARWMNEIVERYRRLDVMVHAAASWERTPLESTSRRELLDSLLCNSVGAFLCCQKAGLQMVQQPSGGSIVLIGDWSIERPYRDFAAYLTSKATIPTMTRALAVEFGERNPSVRVNAILPGPVMLDPHTPTATAEAVKQQSLLKRQGSADHVARGAVFLAEHEFLTGVALPIDGGRSIYAAGAAEEIAHPSDFPHQGPSP